MLAARDLAKASASYCVVSVAERAVGGCAHAAAARARAAARVVLAETPCAVRSRAPQWHASVAFARVPAGACLEVAVWRPPQRVGPLARRARLLGAAVVPLAMHAERGPADDWHALFDARARATGASVHTTLECFWEPAALPGDAAFPATSGTAAAVHTAEGEGEGEDESSTCGICSGLLQPLNARTASAVLLQPPPPPPPPP